MGLYKKHVPDRGLTWEEGSRRGAVVGFPGIIREDDVMVSAFDDIGWYWGGRWDSLKDYQHFSATGH